MLSNAPSSTEIVSNASDLASSSASLGGMCGLVPIARSTVSGNFAAEAVAKAMVHRSRSLRFSAGLLAAPLVSFLASIAALNAMAECGSSGSPMLS